MLFNILELIRKNLFWVIIADIFIALFIGNYYVLPTTYLKPIILFLIYLMLVPPMINLDLKEVIKCKEKKFVSSIIAINFTIFPLLAYIIGGLTHSTDIKIALLLLSLFPTSAMTMSFINLLKGNLKAALIVQSTCLLAGAFLVPVILPELHANLDRISLIKNVVVVVFGPLVIGQIIRKVKGKEVRKEEVKKKLKLLTILGMVTIVFISTLNKAKYIFANLDYMLGGIIAILSFYIAGFFIVSLFKKRISDDNFVTLVYTVMLKNISISISLASLMMQELVIYFVIAYLIQLPLASFIYQRLEKWRSR